MRNQKGFTLFELSLVVAIGAILASILLPKFYQLTLRAEVVGVQGVIGSMRSVLSIKIGSSLYKGDKMVAWLSDGEQPLYPMHDLLVKYPENYLGIIKNSDMRGTWYDDIDSHELVYVLKNDVAVSGVAVSPQKVRWRIEAIYDDRQPQIVKTLHATVLLGLVLKPTTHHKWEY